MAITLNTHFNTETSVGTLKKVKNKKEMLATSDLKTLSHNIEAITIPLINEDKLKTILKQLIDISGNIDTTTDAWIFGDTEDYNIYGTKIKNDSNRYIVNCYVATFEKPSQKLIEEVRESEAAGEFEKTIELQCLVPLKSCSKVYASFIIDENNNVNFDTTDPETHETVHNCYINTVGHSNTWITEYSE